MSTATVVVNPDRFLADLRPRKRGKACVNVNEVGPATLRLKFRAVGLDPNTVREMARKEFLSKACKRIDFDHYARMIAQRTWTNMLIEMVTK